MVWGCGGAGAGGGLGARGCWGLRGFGLAWGRWAEAGAGCKPGCCGLRVGGRDGRGCFSGPLCEAYLNHVSLCSFGPVCLV